MPYKRPTLPPPELVARVERELTPTLYETLLAWSETRAIGVLSLEGLSDPLYPAILVLDAIADTLDGVRTWNPERRPLRFHLMRVVNSRLSHDLERRRRRRHLPFHESEDSGESLIEAEMSLRMDDPRSRPEGSLALAELRGRVYQELRTLAGDDADTLHLIATYADGAQDRAEVMAATGWTLGVFVNVRRRLNTLVRTLPAELREAATDALAREPSRPALVTEAA
jgi:hypothetical protein